MFGKTKTATSTFCAGQELSLEDQLRVGGGGDLDSCINKCANDPKVNTNEKLDACVGKCLTEK